MEYVYAALILIVVIVAISYFVTDNIKEQFTKWRNEANEANMRMRGEWQSLVLHVKTMLVSKKVEPESKPAEVTPVSTVSVTNDTKQD